MAPMRNFIAGEFVDGPAAETIGVIDPATGLEIAQVALADAAEARRAAAAAVAAQAAWGRLTSIERGEFLRRFADALLAHAAPIATALAAESGKSLADAAGEVRYGAEITRYHAEWARRIEGEVIPSDSASETLLLQRLPIGTVACLIPFNYPIYTLLRKIAPALIAGNTVLVRPSNHTPCSALALAAAVQEAGLPAGVINILVMDHPAAEALCTAPGVGMITLTGSVAAGRAVLDYCKPNIAKPSLELGGKTPVIVEPDADLSAVAAAIIRAKTTHCGQVCTAVERVYAQRAIYAELTERLRRGLAAVTIGDRSTAPDAMGPLVDAKARTRVHAMVEAAVAAGATLETGGVIPEGPGFFYPPTLLSGCRQDMAIVQEEVFGPVLAILPYDDLDHAIGLANDHQFGLSAVLFSERYRSAMTVANRIEAGEIYVNRMPADPYQGFHAGWKRSGLGGDDGKHGMLEFTQTRLVVLNY